MTVSNENNPFPSQKIIYHIIRSWNESEIVELYRCGNWWDIGWNTTGITSIIQGSYIFVIAIDTSNNTAIGMGRLISDGVSDGYVQDVAVLSEYRNHGIGTTIATILRKTGQLMGLSWIGLISVPKKQNIYKKAGFNVMTDYLSMNIE